MLTDRGRWILAIGGGTYLAAWAFGALPLYPVALGLVLAVGGAALWVRYLERPMTLLRSLGREEHYAGDDIPIRLEVQTDGVVPSGSLVVVEKITRLGVRETPIAWGHGRLRGSYVLENVARGRYPIESARIVAEDPFGLERAEIRLPLGESLLVYPRLVDLDALFSESGASALEGRRLLLRRPSGFDFHSVREYEQGESLRRVHWPTTAKRGQLMVKELEDAPRDEVAVLLDADASAIVGSPPETSFELQVQAAGSILKAHAVRGRRAALVVNSASRPHQRVHSYDGDWHRALELLASVEADGYASVATLLADEAGTAARALDLAVVTAKLTPRLADRLLQRALTHHGASVIYVDASSFVVQATPRMATDVAAQILRLERGGVPVAVLRRGDDLAAKLGPPALGAAVG